MKRRLRQVQSIAARFASSSLPLRTAPEGQDVALLCANPGSLPQSFVELNLGLMSEFNRHRKRLASDFIRPATCAPHHEIV